MTALLFCLILCVFFNFNSKVYPGFLFDAVQGDVVVTMDADLQDSPDEIPELYLMIKEDGYDLVSGWKKKRLDPVFSKNIPSKNSSFKVSRWIGRRILTSGLRSLTNTKTEEDG